jgi:hypothetical protein
MSAELFAKSFPPVRQRLIGGQHFFDEVVAPTKPSATSIAPSARGTMPGSPTSWVNPITSRARSTTPSHVGVWRSRGTRTGLAPGGGSASSSSSGTGLPRPSCRSGARLRSNPRPSGTLYSLSLACRRLGHVDEARKVAERANRYRGKIHRARPRKSRGVTLWSRRGLFAKSCG